MTHPFVLCLERELAIRKDVYAKRVRDGLMKKEVARAEYDKMEAVLTFIRQCEARYDAEAAYDRIVTEGGANEKMLDPCLNAMALADRDMRLIWEKAKGASQENT